MTLIIYHIRSCRSPHLQIHDVFCVININHIGKNTLVITLLLHVVCKVSLHPSLQINSDWVNWKHWTTALRHECLSAYNDFSAVMHVEALNGQNA